MAKMLNLLQASKKPLVIFFMYCIYLSPQKHLSGKKILIFIILNMSFITLVKENHYTYHIEHLDQSQNKVFTFVFYWQASITCYQIVDIVVNLTFIMIFCKIYA